MRTVVCVCIYIYRQEYHCFCELVNIYIYIYIYIYKSLLHILEWAVGGIGLHVKADKMEYMCFNQRGNISTLKCGPLKLMDNFTYLRSSVSSTEKDINMWLAKAWTAIDRLSVIWKSDLTDKIKHSFSQAVAVLILLYGCITWMLIKRMEKKLDSNYTRMLWAVLNKSWRQHFTKQQLYGRLSPIMKTIKLRRPRYARHRWRSKDKLVSDIILWTPSHGWAKAGRPAGTYIQQFCADTGYSLEDLSGGMDDSDVRRERVWEIRAGGTLWWYIYIYIYIYTHTHTHTHTQTTLGKIMELVHLEDIILFIFFYLTVNKY